MSIEDLLARPEINLALSQLWTRLTNVAIEEDKDVGDVMAEEAARNPKAGPMLALLGVWLNSD